ncbi:hypothetical protein J2754_001082 [Halarchaeum solikamskense]|uniref:hypothetical protein n=1 Tax=Halarchaeum nitratireducens TaxID=489913 RepID=UPI001B3AB1E2|nr:hypothetical protein [Halarchaeum solikamskense]MBP2250765.1 hypothetical protein [Halarchaeum solikamskense]
MSEHTSSLARVGRVVLVVALVSSMVAAPVAGSIASPAAPDGPAATGSGTCSFASVLHFFGVADDCAAPSTTSDVQEVRQAEDNQTELDIYQALRTQKSSGQQFLDSTQNFANSSQNVAWSKGEVAYYRAVQNGSVKAVAREKAMRAIEDYFSKRQVSLYRHFTTQVETARAMHQRAVNESGVDNRTVRIAPEGSPTDDDLGMRWGSGPETSESTLTLLNDTVIQNATYLGGRAGVYTPSADWSTTTWRTLSGPDHDDRHSGLYTTIVVGAPEGADIDGYEFLDIRDYRSAWSHYESLSADTKTEFTTYVNNTYPAIENGRLNASTVLSRETRMFQLGTQAKTSGSLYDSVAALSMMGLATPSLDETGTMTVSYQNRQYQGLLLAPEVPNGTWTAGTSYNATAAPLNGSALLATTTGETISLDSGTFRLTAINDRNGDAIENVSTTRSNYQTTNVTKLTEQLNETQQLIEDVEARQAAGSSPSNPSDSSSGSPLDGDGPIYLVVGLSIISLLVVVALQRDR